jgi:hypothetical protein
VKKKKKKRHLFLSFSLGENNRFLKNLVSPLPSEKKKRETPWCPVSREKKKKNEEEEEENR